MTGRGRPRSFDRQQALLNAVEVFRARGYDGATLEDLLTAMGGIAPPSFYAAFGSKDRLFREAVDLYRMTHGQKVIAALERTPVREGIEAMLRTALQTYANPKGPGGCLILAGAANCTRANKDAHDYLRAMRQEVPARLRARLDRAVAEGDLPKGINLQAIAAFYATVLHGMAIQARDGASARDQEAAITGALAAWSTLVTPRVPAGQRARTTRTTRTRPPR